MKQFQWTFLCAHLFGSVCGFAFACEPLPIVEEAPSSNTLQFETPVSIPTLSRLQRAYRNEKTAESTRRLAAAYASAGQRKRAEKLMRFSALKFPETELYVYAEEFLAGTARQNAIYDAAIAGDPEARRQVVKDAANGSTGSIEKSFWLTMVWKDNFDNFTRCNYALQSQSTLPVKICLSELKQLSKLSRELTILQCHLSAFLRDEN